MAGPAPLLRRIFPEPPGLSGPVRAFHRATIIQLFLFSCFIGLGPFIIILALVLHHGRIGFLFVFAMVALGLLSSAAIDGFRVRVALHRGEWIFQDRGPIRRTEKSKLFWTRAGVYALSTVFKTAGAGVMFYAIVGWITR